MTQEGQEFYGYNRNLINLQKFPWLQQTTEVKRWSWQGVQLFTAKNEQNSLGKLIPELENTLQIRTLTENVSLNTAIRAGVLFIDDK